MRRQTANLVESDFFGHVKGAFTGADRAKIGKFEAAGNGTILLDEIDTLGLEQQAGLLRVIETGEFEPVGSNETQHCTARIIVASNWDLEEAVSAGKFRQDLYYRLNVMSFHLPPLRERVQDIAPLVRAMVARFNTKFRKELFDISPQAMDVLEGVPLAGEHPSDGEFRPASGAGQQRCRSCCRSICRNRCGIIAPSRTPWSAAATPSRCRTTASRWSEASSNARW